MANTQFRSKIGLIAATVGSAVGLGNIWRFPAEAQANGGAAFLLVYVGCVLLLGIPVMLGEFIVGRSGGTDAIGDFRRLSPGKKWWMVGGLGIVASYMILCFYMVVAGWTFEYLAQSITGDLYAPVADAVDQTSRFSSKMHQYIQEDFGPLLNTAIMIIINLGVLICGVRKGIERVSNILMPLLFILLLAFCIVALSLPNASEGLAFFLNPDFSKITPGVVIDALGQAFFSLSLGMGILITYSAYYPRNTRLVRTAFTVSMLDMLVAVMMGIIIFPSVTAFGLTGESLQSTSLVFVTLPEVFTCLPGTQLWSILFFLLLWVAALTSTISIAEVAVRFFQDRVGMSRIKASLTVMLPLFLFSSVCSLSQGSLSDITILGMDIFSLLDTIATNCLLPIGAMLTCLYLGWFAPKGLIKAQLTNEGSIRSRVVPLLIFVLRWIAPVAIATIFVSQFLK
jgi:NSS family neurotransmitter:Na+ symporter